MFINTIFHYKSQDEEIVKISFFSFEMKLYASHRLKSHVKAPYNTKKGLLTS